MIYPVWNGVGDAAVHIASACRYCSERGLTSVRSPDELHGGLLDTSNGNDTGPHGDNILVKKGG